MAQELGEPFITPWVFNNASLADATQRGRTWTMALDAEDAGYHALHLTGQVERCRCGTPEFAIPLVMYKPSRCPGLGSMPSLVEVFGQEMHLQPSEVHLCADIAGWSDIVTLDRRMNFVSRSRKRATHFVPDWDIDLHRQ